MKSGKEKGNPIVVNIDNMNTPEEEQKLGERKLNQDFCDYFTLGPDRAKQREFPISYMELKDMFLEFSKTSIEYLNKLPEEKFTDLPEHNIGKNTETVSESIQRISLHFLGHTGQIYMT